MEWKESDLENDDLKNYKAKAEFYVRQHQDEAVIAKLRGNIPLTEEDIAALERILWSEVGTKQEYEAELGAKPLGEFVREIVGLDMNAAKRADEGSVGASGPALHRPGQRGGGVHGPLRLAGHPGCNRRNQRQCGSIIPEHPHNF